MIGHAWERTGTKRCLEVYVGNGFKLTVGWIESPTDTVYVQEMGTKDSEPLYNIYVWNMPNARAMIASTLAAMLGAPVRSEK